MIKQHFRFSSILTRQSYQKTSATICDIIKEALRLIPQSTQEYSLSFGQDIASGDERDTTDREFYMTG